METLKLDIAKAGVAITADIEAKAQAANALLHSGKGAGNDFLGWVKLPSSISDADIAAIEKEAAKLRAKADVVICIGIGGSYLGAKAVLEAMSDPFKLLHKEQKHPTVLFAGQNISEDYTAELLDAVKEHSIAAIVISKSGTTTEPAIAFRLIKAEIEKRYGKKEAAERIVAITDKARGALKTLATQEGYPTFVIPDDVGGRFSVLTPVGLLPLAVAGVDIAALVHGAQEMEKATAEGVPFNENPIKGIVSPINGQADVLIFPNIESGNAFYKSVSLFAKAEMAGLLQGPICPVVLPSRSDSGLSKYYSIAMACLQVSGDCECRKQGTQVASSSI